MAATFKSGLVKHGDQNTKFFHQKATGRAKKNRIRSLKKQDGQFTDNPKEICTLEVDYFSMLFTNNGTVVPE